MWLVIVQVEIQGSIFILYTHFPAQFAEGTLFPSMYILTSLKKIHGLYLFYSLRLRICFCFYDFAVCLEIRYGHSSSVVCREAWTGLQSGSCLGQKFSDNWWTDYCFFLVSPFENVTVPLSSPYSRSYWMFMNSTSIIESQHPSQNNLLIDLSNAHQPKYLPFEL